MAAYGFVYANDIDWLFAMKPRENATAINEYGRAVEASDRHHATRHILVATTDRDECVHTFAGDDGFDTVGDDFAGNQAIPHALRAHADPVRDRNRAEIDGFAACFVGTTCRVGREFVDVHVARREVAASGSDRDLRFFEIVIVESDGSQH